MTLSYKWSVDPKEFVKSVRASVATKTAELTEAVFDGVVERSPVRTGSFRSSWDVSVGEPRPKFVKGGSHTSPMSAPNFPGIRLDPQNPEKTYVTNGAPYGTKIEDGSSSQAPNGVVALTLQSLKR